MGTEQSNNGENPLISIVMATYAKDSLAHLQQAIASLLAQTYSELELIIVQDGPLPEESTHYLKQTASDDSQVRIVTLPENQGAAAARNAGIREARGGYIAIADADDISARERLERQLAHLTSQEADLIGSFYRVIDDSGHPLMNKHTPVDYEALRRCACLFNPIANPTVFAKADVLRDNPYPEEYSPGIRADFGEDFSLWVTLLLKGFRICNQPEYLVDFRAGSGFLERRGGASRFWSDVYTKRRALQLLPACYRPFALGAGAMVSLARVLPTPIRAVAYWLRNRFTFAS